jgi:hypothetical protein
MDFATTARGGVYAASIHSNITGRGADLIIVDDPLGIADATNLEKIKKVNDIFDREVVSRLDDHTTGQILIIMHRLGDTDLFGHVLEQGLRPHRASVDRAAHEDVQTWLPQMEAPKGRTPSA